MICRSALIAIVACGCAEDIPTFRAATTALTSTELAPPTPIPPAFGSYRWELVDAPADGTLGDLSASTPTIVVTPPVRGVYVLDRWFVGEAADQISDHVVMTAEGAAPSASISGPAIATIAAAATFDGRSSASPEHLALQFQWRLATRPATSAAEPADTSSPTLSVVPDVPGTYDIELRVFDGELWSVPTLVSLNARWAGRRPCIPVARPARFARSAPQTVPIGRHALCDRGLQCLRSWPIPRSSWWWP